MYVKNFKYAGENLEDYGYMICEFEDTNGFNIVENGSIIQFNTAKSSRARRWNIVSSDYSEPLTFQLSIVRTDGSEIPFSEISTMSRWLNRTGFNKLELESDITLFCNAAINISRVELGGRCYGFTLDITTDSTHMYKDEISLDFRITSINGIYTITDSSDLVGYIYPYIEITPSQSGTLIITNNQNPNHKTEILNCIQDEKIILNGERQLITTEINTSPIALADRFNFKFPKLINEYSNRINTYTFTLPCNVKFVYSPIAKVGV